MFCLAKCKGISDIKGILDCDIQYGCDAWKWMKQEYITCGGAEGADRVLSCTKKQRVNVAGNMVLSK